MTDISVRHRFERTGNASMFYFFANALFKTLFFSVVLSLAKSQLCGTANMQFCKIGAWRNNSRLLDATQLQLIGWTVILPASGVLATPLSAAGFFVVQVKFLTFIVIGNRADSYKIPQLRKAAAVMWKALFKLRYSLIITFASLPLFNQKL